MKAKSLLVFGLLCVGAVAALLFWPEKNIIDKAATPFLALSRVPVLEIPPTAAELVHSAPEATREDTARDVVRAVGAIARPGALPFVVNSICGKDPQVAGAVVETATQLQPDDVLVFCKAALSAAPAKAYQIVYEASGNAPAYCAAVALTASKQLPSANELIMSAFVNAHPEFEPYLEKAQIQVGPNFEAVVKRTVLLFNEAATSHPK